MDTPILLPHKGQLFVRSIRTESSNDNGRQASFSRVEDIRDRLQTEGISEEAAHLVSKAWSRGTNSAYQLAWTRWERWCLSRDPDSYTCDVKFFINFLASLFEQGLQHRTVNTICSAFSVTHDKCEGFPIGQHPMATRLMKGIYNERPPKPRYTTT